jgi:glutaredoxin
MTAMYYHIYVKRDCALCEKAIELLIAKEKEFIVTALEHSLMMERATKKKHKHETVPIVVKVKVDTIEICEDEDQKSHLNIMRESKFSLVGGYAELKKHLDKERRSLVCLDIERGKKNEDD